MRKEDVLKQCSVDGNIVRLPNGQLDRPLYLEVAKALELIGGKWKSGKIKGFVFKTNPSELLHEIASGEKRNLKKEYQFFPTPEKIADRLIHYALLKNSDVKTILEPSAGQGAIIKAINKVTDIVPDCYELMDINRIILNKSGLRFNLIGNDFLEHEDKTYDRIIANPPFANGQDIEHFFKMAYFLNDNGILVSIMYPSSFTGTNRKQKHFQDFIAEKDCTVYDIEAKEFSESGTNIETKILVYEKWFSLRKTALSIIIYLII